MFSDVNLPTTEFELLDNIADLLKPVSITLLFALIVGDHLQKNKNGKPFQDTTDHALAPRYGRKVALTRKVALSNSRTSSASMICAKFLRFVSSCWTFGMSWYTMLDHACREIKKKRILIVSCLVSTSKHRTSPMSSTL